MNVFKKQLKYFLGERRISGAELSRRTNIPKQTISDWLAGTRPRNMDFVKKVADVLEVSVLELLFTYSVASEEPCTPSTELLQGAAGFFMNHSQDLLQVRRYPVGFPAEYSKSWETTLGWSSADLSKKLWLDLIYPDDCPNAVLAMEKHLQKGGNPVLLRHRLLHKSGRPVLMDTVVFFCRSNQVLLTISTPVR